MLFIYLIIGILTSFIGALPLGASNIAVMNTTIRQNAKQALKIVLAAGLAEVILSYYALHCNMAVRDFFDRNIWIQISIVVVLMLVGAFLFFKKNKDKSAKPSRFTSKYATGFILGLFNPPVLLYWIVAFGFINTNAVMLSLQSSLPVLVLFFLGVYLGKVLTLYGYSKFSLIIKNRSQNIGFLMNKVTGVLLVIIALAQAIKLSL